MNIHFTIFILFCFFFMIHFFRPVEWEPEQSGKEIEDEMIGTHTLLIIFDFSY